MSSLQALFSAVARDIPAILLQKPPRCTDIVELPFSMSAMDHLVGVANRTSLRGGEGAGERGFMQVICVYVCAYMCVCICVYMCVCICVYLDIYLCVLVCTCRCSVAVSASLGVELSFEESAERVYAAMMKVCVYAVCVCVCACGCVRIQFGSTHPPSLHTSLLMDHTLPPPHSMAHTGLSSTWPPSTGGCQVIPRTQWSVSGGPSTLPLQKPRMWATSDWPAFFIAMVTFLMQWWLQGQPWTSLEAR